MGNVVSTVEQNERKKVLIVDDEQQIVEILKMCLSGNYHVDSTTDPTQARDLLITNVYHCLFTDLSFERGKTITQIANTINGINLIIYAHETAKSKNRTIGCVLHTSFSPDEISPILSKHNLGKDMYFHIEKGGNMNFARIKTTVSQAISYNNQ